MTHKLPIFILFLFLCFGLSAQENETIASLNRLEWIIGTWERQNGKPGEIHHERWQKVSDQHLKGIGVVVVGSDTIFVEKLAIRVEEGIVYYIADVKENPEPVYFKFTSWEENSFVSENPKHDAPKKIAYNLEGDIMTAKVSWDDGGFEAIFKKIE